MNRLVNHRSVIVSTVVIVVALLCIALFVGVLLIHANMNEARLVMRGIMIVQAQHIVVGILPPCCFE